MTVNEIVYSNKEEYINFLSQLVQTDTQVLGHGVLGGKEKAGQEIIKQKLLDLGFEIDEFLVEDEKIKKFPGANLGHDNRERPNIVGILKGTGGGKSLILNGHIDTMPFGDRDKWSNDPFLGQVQGDVLYGLGSTDMKASLAAMILAAQVIKTSGIQLKGDLIIQSVVDEEGGGNGTLACVERGYTADAAIVGEPTQLHIQPAHMGFLFHEIVVEGHSLHSSQLWEGVNAIDKAIKIYQSLKDLEHRWLMTEKHPLLPGPTINLGEIAGGIAGSVVPGSCTLKTCLHYQPKQNEAYGLTRERVNSQVLGAIESVVNGDEWLKEHPPQVNVYQEGYPFETPITHSLVQEMKSVIEDVLQKEAVIEGMPAGCDARILSGFGKIPTIIVGCGDPRQCHCVDESVPISQFLSLIEIYVNFIISWCDVESINLNN
ncbi:ArgE/DapE family deacylase [Peribacillus huizhouensis]|uniref:Acetylornithine deacetylase n=1 Tax=Peribacillus huizhouensis TaxID=1501239 RepID=A0ABR6CMV0_9BACI|nr:ArgE/DapE family deacylase [Peribacillus huizhouensis]MBA9026356.1 acetylornithine deacetylase [Peribacillus huizhouensis]